MATHMFRSVDVLDKFNGEYKTVSWNKGSTDIASTDKFDNISGAYRIKDR